MKVEPTGIVMLGLCSIRTQKCTARKMADAVTAVWTVPARTQIDVCRACLEEQLRNGLWEAEGVRVPGMRHRADVVVFDSKHHIALIVEVKANTNENESWIISNSDRLSRHLKSECKYILYITPVYSYMIDLDPECHNRPETEWKVKTRKVLEPYITLSTTPRCHHDSYWVSHHGRDTEEVHQALQDAVKKWLTDVTTQKIRPEILNDDLISRIKNGEVKSEVVLQ